MCSISSYPKQGLSGHYVRCSRPGPKLTQATQARYLYNGINHISMKKMYFKASKDSVNNQVESRNKVNLSFN